jgi:hypothetical protein
VDKLEDRTLYTKITTESTTEKPLLLSSEKPRPQPKPQKKRVREVVRRPIVFVDEERPARRMESSYGGGNGSGGRRPSASETRAEKNKEVLERVFGGN